MTGSFRPINVLDSHIHYGHPELMSGLIEVLDQNKLDRCNIVCTPHHARLSLVPDALHLKAHFPGRIYVFGGLDISPFFTAPQTCGTHFAAYLDVLAGMGCDGIKMIEGKPDTRKEMNVPPFDSPVYAPYWEKLEETGLPVVFHVNDPEEFWDANRVPVWAKEVGWFWGDGSFINNEVQYAEILNVLRRYPRIKVIFAHFFFLSGQLERLSGYLDEFPNMHVDLTPGIEMYENFARDPQKARDFFLKYQDRILFGTDIGAMALLHAPGTPIDPIDSKIRVDLVRSFLEQEGPLKMDVNPDQAYLFGKFAPGFQAIHLPDEALEKIYHQNFERLAGSTPRPVNPRAISAECRRLSAIIPAMAAAQPGVPGDISVAELVLSFFSQ